MTDRIHAPNVGAPDPELRTSPIAEENDEAMETLKQEVQGEPVCTFNGKAFAQGALVCSGGALLRCDYGIWVEIGSCDPDNP